MFKNYLTIALRNIFRNKLFSTVNILGLVFGICSAMLIFLWVNDEMAVDGYHQNIDRLYRVMENQEYSDGRIYTFAATPGPMAPVIKEKFPEIERATRFTWPIRGLFQFDEFSFYEEGRYVDPDFLSMFTFPLVKGDSSTALGNNNSIVISEAMAKKYFGDEEPVGKVFTFNKDKQLTVTGVLKDVPPSSSMRFDYLLPFEIFWNENKSWLDQWGNNNIRTYLLLAKGTDAKAFGDKLKMEVHEHNENSNVALFIQPYGEVYLNGDFENGIQSGGRIEYVRIFFIVAIFVLVIACINFMNLATAQATKRAKEVGLRKVIGAVPIQLFRQFMGESFLTVFIAAGVAIGLAYLLIPTFNSITGKSLGLNLLDMKILGIFLIVIVGTGFVAGSYPAIFISDFKPVQVLKGQLKSGRRASLFRKVLVVVQFSLSIILIISTAVVFRQMAFMENRDIGFDRNNLFYAWMESDVRKDFTTFKERLLADPNIESVTAASQLPIDVGNSTIGVDWEGKAPDEEILFSNINVDYDFVQSMKMEMAEGRPYDKNQPLDSNNYIVNEKAAEKFGFKDGVAGQELTMWEKKGRIVGVVKDFNFGSLHNPIDPLIMRIDVNNLYCMIIRAKDNNTATAISATENLWKEYAPGYPFKYSFLNQDWEAFYNAEAQRGKVFNTLAVLSIFISCLGLFGLSAFSAERRTKELGIRKALGASVPGLVQLMGKEFGVLVAIAALVGCPVGWYMMNAWLLQYAFHIEVGWITLLVAAASCFGIALITIAYHSIRVATTSPVKSLRYE